jgi:SAM-dependent methyltransferase
MVDTDDLMIEWNQRHADPTHQPQAAEVLYQNRHLLPCEGEALDLACGLGGNALLMAKAGLQVTAWDLSPVAIQRLQGFAGVQGLTNLRAEVRDLNLEHPQTAGYDVIVVSYFLDRGLIPTLVEALRTGGLIFYQTFTRIAVTERGPSNPAYRLGDNELLELFESLAVRVYREENRLGDRFEGIRDVAMLVAQKI